MNPDRRGPAARGSVPRRAWLWAQGSVLLPAVLAVVAIMVAAVATTGQAQDVRMVAVAGAVVLGVIAFVTARTWFGAAATQGRVDRERAGWAGAHGWSFDGDVAAADPAAVDLALPRGWSAPAAAGSMRGWARGRGAVVQTWVLRSATTSTRQSSRREVVVVHVPTGGRRCAVSNATLVDPLLITPAWVRSGRGDLAGRGSRRDATRAHVYGDPEAVGLWGDAIRRAVEVHRDVPLTVVVGADRVLVFAMDDPRVETAEARLELAGAVADIVDPGGGVSGPEPA